MNKNIKQLITGNDAIAEAAIRAGCRAYYGYPITPQSQIGELLSRRMRDVEGVFIQTESELAAINAVYGSSAAGVRAMTSSASTAWSLMQEGISQLSYMELPAVIINTMRGGPGLGNPFPTQGDYQQATKGGGSGDYNLIILAPSSVQEAADLTVLAFELADKYRNPTVILIDGVIARTMESALLPDFIDITQLPEKSWALTGANNRNRRLIEPCNTSLDLEHKNIQLQNKFKQMAQNELRYELFQTEDAELIIVAFGICSRIARACVLEARKSGLKLGLLRPITLWPFPYEVIWQQAQKTRSFLVVEMNAGQMWQDVYFATRGRIPVHFHGRTGGMLPVDREVYEALELIYNSQMPPDWEDIKIGSGIWKTA